MSERIDQHINHIRVEVENLEKTIAAKSALVTQAEATIVAQQQTISELKVKLGENPPPTEPPAEPSPALPPGFGPVISVTQATIAADLKKVRDDAKLLFPAGGTIRLPFGVTIVHDRVTVDTYGGTDQCTLIGDGEISVIFGVSGTADSTKVRNLHFTSNDPRGSRPFAVFVSGTNTLFDNCSCSNVKQFFGNKSSARNTKVRNCKNLKARDIEQHWFYDNGRGTVLEENTINAPTMAGYRCNNSKNGTLRNNTFIGGPAQEARISIQKGDGFVVEGNTIKDTHIGNSTLGGKDAYLQDGKEGMLAARTLNVKWLNNVCENVKLIVGTRTENTTISGNTGGIVLELHEKDEVFDPNKYGLDGESFTLPGAKNIVQS
jgi:hypothetical protein